MYIYIYIYRERERERCMAREILPQVKSMVEALALRERLEARFAILHYTTLYYTMLYTTLYILELGNLSSMRVFQPYGQFSKSYVCFCGLDPGTLKSDIVSTKHPQLICSDLRLSN